MIPLWTTLTRQIQRSRDVAANALSYGWLTGARS